MFINTHEIFNKKNKMDPETKALYEDKEQEQEEEKKSEKEEK